MQKYFKTLSSNITDRRLIRYTLTRISEHIAGKNMSII